MSKIYYIKEQSASLKLLMYAGNNRLPIIKSLDAKNIHWKEHRWRTNLGVNYLKWIFEKHYSGITDLTSVRILATANHPFLAENTVVEVYAINEGKWVSPELYKHIQATKKEVHNPKQTKKDNKQFALYIPLKEGYFIRKDNKILRAFTIYNSNLINLKEDFFKNYKHKMAENTQPQLYNWQRKKVGWLDLNTKNFVLIDSAIAS